MRILIHDRLRPYSHMPGTRCILPFTHFQFRFYPALIQIYSLRRAEPLLVQEIGLNVVGPVDQFTVQLDLERGWIRVWGKAVNGFFRFRIQKKEEHWAAAIEKDEVGGIFLSGEIEILNKDDKPLPIQAVEHLSFGNHKAQDVDGMKQRCQMQEIFPFWFRLGQLIPSVSLATGGVADLLKDCSAVIKESNCRGAILDQKFKNIFLTGFEGIFSPRLQDVEHQGFSLPEPCGSPLWLLQEGARLIRSLFFQEVDDECLILPTVPPQYHCGKMKGIESDLAFFDIEWTKKQLRRMVMYGKKNGEMHLRLPHEMRYFRFHTFEDRAGKKMDSKKVTLQIRDGETYFLDRFER